MPNSMDLIFTPFIVILIAVAIALLVLGRWCMRLNIMP
jgi:PTS system sucrose-specific IIC component